MNEQTADHYNMLLTRVNKPLELEEQDDGTYNLKGGQDDDERRGVHAFIREVVKRIAPQAIADEIRNAAAKHEIAVTYITNDRPLYQGVRGAGKRARELALPEVRLEIERRNADAVARFEAYRLACEQGVAVPPAEQNNS